MNHQKSVYTSLNQDYVDVHGHNLKAQLAEDGSIFLPLQEVHRAGFHIFPKSNFNRMMVTKHMILMEFQLHMLGAAKKYLMQNSEHSLNCEDILETIEICRQQLIKEDMERRRTTSSGTLGRTLLSDPADVNKEVRSVIRQNMQHRVSNRFDNIDQNHVREPSQNHVREPSRAPLNDSGPLRLPKQASSMLASTSTLDEQNSRQNDVNFLNKRNVEQKQPQNRRFQNNDQQVRNRNCSNFGNNVTPKRDSDSRSISENEEKEYIKLSDCKVERIQLQRTMQKVKVVHIENSNDKEKYWVQLVENEILILDIIEKCEASAGSAQWATPKLGEIYMAMSPDDEIWYRVVVLRTYPLIKVNFIDFGNDGIVSKVKELSNDLRNIPAQAVRITISRAEGSAEPRKLNLDEVASVRFAKQFSDGTVCASLEANNGGCENYKEAPKKIAAAESEWVCFEPVFIDRIKFSTVVMDDEVVRIIAYSGGKFYLRNREHHMKLKDIENHIKELPREAVTNIKMNQVVICKKEGEEQLCRGVVCKIEDGRITVQFIDFHELQTFEQKALFGISKKVAHLPVALIESPIIKGYDANKFGEEAKALMEQIIGNKSKLIVKSAGIEFDLNIDGRSLSDMLFPTDVKLAETDLKLRSVDEAKPSKPAEKVVEKPLQATPDRTQEQPQQKKSEIVCNTNTGNVKEETTKIPAAAYVRIMFEDMPTYLPPMGIGDYMLTTFKDSAEFTVTPMGDKETELLTRCTLIDVDDNEPYTPVDTEMVLARFEDGWYRAAVVDVLADDKFEVLFVEYGNMAQLTKDDIRKFPKEFREIPMLGIMCCMDVPDTEPVKKRLEELLKPETIFEMNFISYDSENLLHTIEIPKIKEQLAKEKII